MAVSPNRYFVKSDDGGWDVVKEGHRRASAHARNKADAVARATALTKQAGGGEVVVMGRSGKIVEANTIPRSRSSRASK